MNELKVSIVGKTKQRFFSGPLVMSSHKVSLLLGISLALLLLAVSSVRGESANAEPEGEPEPENGATTQAHAANFYQVCSLSTFKPFIVPVFAGSQIA